MGDEYIKNVHDSEAIPGTWMVQAWEEKSVRRDKETGQLWRTDTKQEAIDIAKQYRDGEKEFNGEVAYIEVQKKAE